MALGIVKGKEGLAHSLGLSGSSVLGFGQSPEPSWGSPRMSLHLLLQEWEFESKNSSLGCWAPAGRARVRPSGPQQARPAGLIWPGLWLSCAACSCLELGTRLNLTPESDLSDAPGLLWTWLWTAVHFPHPVTWGSGSCFQS